MDLLLFRQAAVLIASGIGGYTDYKTGYINDWTTLPLIGLGILFNIYEGELLGIAIGAVVFVIGYVLYYTGKLGGGDVKLYTGIALALPFYGKAVFILPAAFYAALSGVVFFSAYYGIKYLRKGIDIEYNRKGITNAAVLLAFIIVYTYFLLSSGIAPAQYAITLGIMMACGCFFVAFERGIRKEFFLKKIKISEMEEDEIIALDFMEEGTRKKLGLGIKNVFGEKEKGGLLKAGIKEILVYRNLPRFGAFIFIGVAIAMLAPKLSLKLIWGP